MANLGIFIVVLLTIAGVVRGQQASGVRATFNVYNMAGINYNLFTASVFCASTDGNMPLGWRSKYPWTAFCGPAGPAVAESCGRCLLVTNSETGAQAVVRIVDQCSNGGLDLEEGVFARLDSNQQGNAQGHLIVDYEFVDCGD